MSFLTKFKKVYEVGFKCENCGKTCKDMVPKGTKVNDHIKGGLLKCDYCGCSSQPKEYTTEYYK